MGAEGHLWSRSMTPRRVLRSEPWPFYAERAKSAASFFLQNSFEIL